MSIQEETIGAPIVATVRNPDGSTRNIADATSHDLIFMPPNGQKMTKPAAFLTDGSDGKLVYTTVEGDLTPAGAWRVQAYIRQPGFDGSSKVGTFFVLKNL